MNFTKTEQIIIMDSLIVMLGIALSRSAALKHHNDLDQSKHFANQCAHIRALIGKLESMWNPQISNQTILKF